MNIRALQQSIEQDSHVVSSAINYVFSTTINRVKKTNRAVNALTFVGHLNAALDKTGVRVHIDTDDLLASPTDQLFYPVLSALCYEPKHAEKPAKIRLTISLHSSTNRLVLSEDAWEFFRFKFWKIVTHELVHRAQYQKGRTEQNMFVFKTQIEDVKSEQYKNQKYLGELDEIEAYARDCYEEWHYFYPNTEMTLDALQQDFGPHATLPTIEFYYETFGEINALPVKRLFSKTLEWNKHVKLPIAQYIPKITVTLQKMKEQNKTK